MYYEYVFQINKKMIFLILKIIINLNNYNYSINKQNGVFYMYFTMW